MKLLYAICFTAVYLFGSTAISAQESDPVMLFFKNGEKYRSQEKYKEAIGEYDHALAISDTSSMIHYWKGISYFMLKDAENAAQALEKAMSLNPTYQLGLQALLKVYTVTNDTDKLLSTYNRLANTSTGANKIDNLNKGLQVLVKAERFAACKTQADVILKLDPKNLEALYVKGMVNNHLGHYDIARKTMESAVGMVKSTDEKVIARYYYELGYAYHKLGDYAKSDEAFNKANVGPYRELIAKLKPGYYYNVATSYNMIYEYEIAKEMLNTALKIDKSYYAANMLLAEISIKEEHHHKGIHFYKEALKDAGEDMDNNHEKIYNKLIETLLNAKKFNESISTSDECLAKFPGARNVRFMKSIALHRHDKAQEGIDILETLLGDGSITPIESLMYNFALGAMYATIKDFEKAKGAYAKARRGPFANAAQFAYERMVDEMAVAEENTTGKAE